MLLCQICFDNNYDDNKIDENMLLYFTVVGECAL